jgi:hypothetical protein
MLPGIRTCSPSCRIYTTPKSNLPLSSTFKNQYWAIINSFTPKDNNLIA